MRRLSILLAALILAPLVAAAATQVETTAETTADALASAPTDAPAAAAPEAVPVGDLRLVHPADEQLRRVSGDRQTVFAREDGLLHAQVLDAAGRPVEGVPVNFAQITPREKFLGHAESDVHGIASVVFTAGKKEKTHAVVASIPGGDSEAGQIVYQIPVRKRSWVLFMVFGLLGGLGIFLFGMDMMSSSMQRSAGGRLRSILGALTRNRFIGAFVGAVVTMIIQSSSATTVMMVSFVQAKLIGFAQTLGVNLGANVGTTVTAQLIAFKLTDYALLMVAIGFGLKYLGKKETLRNAGDVLLGFGLLFYGMFVMSKAMYPLRSYQPFLDMLQNLEAPLLGILVGTIFTALIQSSSAFTGIVIVLAQQGFLTLEAGIPLIIGANIGTCITAGLASLGGIRDAKRVALAHTLFNVTGMLVFVWWIPTFADLVRGISPGGEIASGDTASMARFIPRQVANAHTVFNIAVTLVFLPFTGYMARLVKRLLPDKEMPEIEAKYAARFLDAGMLSTPALALNLAKAEILRMGKRVKKMTEMLVLPFLERDLDACDRLHELESEVDILDKQISSYLIDIGKQDLNEQQVEEVYLMMHVTKQYEHVADIVDKDLRPLAKRMISEGIDFSESGREEVRAFHKRVVKQVGRSLAAFREGSLEKARRITQKQVKYRALESTYRQTHFERIRSAVSESVASSEIHLDLMDGMRRMNSYAANVAREILARGDGAVEEEEVA